MPALIRPPARVCLEQHVDRAVEGSMNEGLKLRSAQSAMNVRKWVLPKKSYISAHDSSRALVSASRITAL